MIVASIYTRQLMGFVGYYISK